MLYTTSGQASSQLYGVDGLTGELQVIGVIGFDNVTGLSFHPQQAILWGWSNQGLLHINVETGVGTLVFSEMPPHFEVQGLVWDITDTLLYAVVDGPQTHSTLWVYNGNSWKIACEGLPDKVESLEMRPDGFLLYGVHNDTQLDVHAYQVQTCQTVFEAYINTPYNDIESLAWPTLTCPSYPPNLEALRAYLEGLEGVTAVTIGPDGSILVKISSETHHGQLASEVTPGTPPSDGKLQLIPIADANGDGKDDFKVTYPSGDQQVIYDLGVTYDDNNNCTNKCNQNITFSPLPTKTYGDPNFTLSATGGGSGNPVTFSVTAGPCMVNGSIVHITDAGSCTIQADQAGNSNYDPASSVSQTLIIRKLNQTILFRKWSGAIYSGEQLSKYIYSSSGLLPRFTALRPKCQVRNYDVLIGAELCAIRIEQDGNDKYNPTSIEELEVTLCSRNDPEHCSAW